MVRNACRTTICRVPVGIRSRRSICSGLTDGKATALVAHRQAFHWVYPGFTSTKLRPKGAPAEFPAMYTGKFPLPEATIYSRAVREGSQADTHDVGIINVPTVEPGRHDKMVFEYAFATDAAFDPVTRVAYGRGIQYAVAHALYGASLRRTSTRGFFSVDQPNVEIVAVKTPSENVVHGEVSASPLDPKVNKVFIIRLQEFAGRAATVSVNVPATIRSAALMNLTENIERQKITQVSPLTVSMRPFETATVRIEIE